MRPRVTVKKSDVRAWRWLIRELSWQGLGASAIGRLIGRDHATVLYHLRADPSASMAPHLVHRGAGI